MDSPSAKLLDPARGRGEKALFILSCVSSPASTGSIRDYGLSLGLREISKWNLSEVLRRQAPFCARFPDGWVLTPEGERELAGLGYLNRSPLVSKTRLDLENHVNQIQDPARRNFAHEAVSCFNGGLNRACVVLSWVGAIWILQHHIVNNYLQQFNAAGSTRFKSAFKNIITMQHFSRMQESDILQICEDIGLLDKSMKNQLVERLNFRNACGHPNMIVVDDHGVAHHVEFLLNNVYKKF